MVDIFYKNFFVNHTSYQDHLLLEQIYIPEKMYQLNCKNLYNLCLPVLNPAVQNLLLKTLLYDLNFLQDDKGRIWITNQDIYKKIEELYNVKLIEQKEFDTRYKGQKYNLILIEK